ncbi:TerB family tellurite resistance protein [Cytophaga aurantiaca]|uniref:tellurite resistance TerB family protein n=1 Tax=Cytophaga aurantiaca TaxID=29530 RepID=UPI000375A3BA|nr:TerB family tellurite resistance protein [Cytophaga aurantiaca]
MNETGLLDVYTDEERTAYIGAIASIATADRTATEDELEYLSALCEAAAVKPSVAQDAAKDITNAQLPYYLDVLKQSELRFSLITDIISFAKSDGQYTADEQEKIKGICRYLDITDEQTGVLNNLVEKSSALVTIPEEANDKGFFEKHGFSNMLEKANIPINSIVKGLIGVAVPFILSKMVNRRAQSGSISGGGLGGGLGGTLLGAFQGGRIGGLGSILANLNGNKPYNGLGSILKRAIQQKA